jgi:FAD/FMN-containing dehydrogenase
LFWALRGAGSGNFGVVTSLVLRTRPASSATNFHLAWPYSGAASVIDAWQAWAPVAPDELYASLLLTAGGDVERPALNLFGSMLGSEQDAAKLLDELTAPASADPTTDVRKPLIARSLSTLPAHRSS